MWPNPQETEDLITFTEQILNWKLFFVCSAGFQSFNVALCSNMGAMHGIPTILKFIDRI